MGKQSASTIFSIFTMNKLLYTITTSLAIWGCAATMATASDYVSPSGQTQLSLRELNQGSSTRGFYFTTLQGQQWRGDIKINRIEGGAGHVFYSGTFDDFHLGPDTEQTCTGDILLDRTGANGVAPQVSLRVKWTVKGGTNCPSAVGDTFEVQLMESLPQADRNGNYTSRNATTAIGETNGPYTWPIWSVIAADGKLNCRATPEVAGKVTFTYKTGDRFDTRNRGANSLETATDGTTWLKVPPKKCFVRASDRAVKPVSIPF
jgi:hypothetical protein